MKYLLNDLRTVALDHPGLWDQLIEAGTLDATRHYIDIDEGIYDQIMAACTAVKPMPVAVPEAQPVPILPTAMPRSEWPRIIRLLALFAVPEDRGIGDVVARLIGPFGGDAFKLWTKRFGLDCGCEVRQADWNIRWPLK